MNFLNPQDQEPKPARWDDEQKPNPIFSGEEAPASNPSKPQEPSPTPEHLKHFSEIAEDVFKSDPMFQVRDGDDGWNKSVNERLTRARDVFNGRAKAPSRDDIVRGVVASVAYPHVSEQMAALRKENEELRARLSKGGK